MQTQAQTHETFTLRHVDVHTDRSWFTCLRLHCVCVCVTPVHTCEMQTQARENENVEVGENINFSSVEPGDGDLAGFYVDDSLQGGR